MKGCFGCLIVLIAMFIVGTLFIKIITSPALIIPIVIGILIIIFGTGLLLGRNGK